MNAARFLCGFVLCSFLGSAWAGHYDGKVVSVRRATEPTQTQVYIFGQAAQIIFEQQNQVEHTSNADPNHKRQINCENGSDGARCTFIVDQSSRVRAADFN